MQIISFLNHHILEFPFWFGLIVLAKIVFLQFFKRDWLKKYASRIFLYSTFVVFAYLIYVAFLQFRAFQSGPLGLTLGTGDGLSWFFGYIRLHFWNDYLFSFVFAVAFALFGGYVNKRYNERFFEKEELYVLALAILLVGYPAFIFYIPITLFVSAIASALFMKRAERMPLYNFWAPVALVVLLIVQFWAANQAWWGSLRF